MSHCRSRRSGRMLRYWLDSVGNRNPIRINPQRPSRRKTKTEQECKWCGLTKVERLRPADAEQPTCNGVEPCDHQHQDGGEVKVPAQADLHKEGPRVQVRLCVEEETQGLGWVTSAWLQSPRGLLRERQGNGRHHGYSKDIAPHVPGGHLLKPALKPGVPHGWRCHRCRWVSQATFPQLLRSGASSSSSHRCSWAQLDAGGGTQGSEMGCLGALVLPQPLGAKRGARNTQPLTGSGPDLSYPLVPRVPLVPSTDGNALLSRWHLAMLSAEPWRWGTSYHPRGHAPPEHQHPWVLLGGSPSHPLPPPQHICAVSAPRWPPRSRCTGAAVAGISRSAWQDLPSWHPRCWQGGCQGPAPPLPNWSRQTGQEGSSEPKNAAGGRRASPPRCRDFSRCLLVPATPSVMDGAGLCHVARAH